MDQADPDLIRIWNQGHIPVIVRGGRLQPLVVRLPYAQGNREWLQQDRRSKPKWLRAAKTWGIPKSWFEDTVRRTLDRFGAVYVIQPVKPEKCAPACWNALGALCECSCMGANHGSGNPVGKWHIVSETRAVRIGPREYSCRLLRPYLSGRTK